MDSYHARSRLSVCQSSGNEVALEEEVGRSQLRAGIAGGEWSTVAAGEPSPDRNLVGRIIVLNFKIDCKHTIKDGEQDKSIIFQPLP